MHAEFAHFENDACRFLLHSPPRYAVLAQQHVECLRHFAVGDHIVDGGNDTRQDRTEDFTRDQADHEGACLVINACPAVFDDQFLDDPADEK